MLSLAIYLNKSEKNDKSDKNNKNSKNDKHVTIRMINQETILKTVSCHMQFK
jgi:hypothetical protein